jgi:hypothetical protein
MQEVNVESLTGSRRFKVVTEDGRTEFVNADRYIPGQAVAEFRVYLPGTVANADGYRASQVTATFRYPKQVTEVPNPDSEVLAAAERIRAAQAKADSDRAAARMKEAARVYMGVYPWVKPKPRETVVATLTIDAGGYGDAKKTDMIRLLNDFCKRQSYGLDIISIEVEVKK